MEILIGDDTVKLEDIKSDVLLLSKMYPKLTIQALCYKIEEQQRIIDAMETRTKWKDSKEEDIDQAEDEDYDYYPGNEAGAFDEEDFSEVNARI